jgi:glycosyltransferase involved in cell wall biosynthesis
MTSVVILNWNTSEIVGRSLTALAKEPDIEVVVVNNGCTDWRPGSWHLWKDIHDFPIRLIEIDENIGSSRGRNIGIQATKGDRIFLLDGDIEYVPKTIEVYNLIMNLTKARCVGHNNLADVLKQGYNGTRDRALADAHCRMPATVDVGFPMAWTQYGLFSGEFLRYNLFPTSGAFGEPGHGYEDDWLYQSLIKAFNDHGVVAVEEPIYFHQAHSSMAELEKKNLETRTDERGRLFRLEWPNAVHWAQLLRSGQMTIKRYRLHLEGGEPRLGSAQVVDARFFAPKSSSLS